MCRLVVIRKQADVCFISKCLPFARCRRGLKRAGLCFHSFRHTVAGKLEQASVSQTDAARVLGHAIAGMSYGVYSSGPGLKRLAAIVEEIRYDLTAN